MFPAIDHSKIWLLYAAAAICLAAAVSAYVLVG
jgi:hypothetical protein